MNCADLHRLLAFDDATLAPDPIALRTHLSECAACRREHFDLAALFCVEPARARVRGRGVYVGIAAALLLGIGIALVRVAPSAPNTSAVELAAAVPRRLLPRAETSQVTKEVSTLSGGSRRSLYSVSQSTSGPITRSNR